MTVESGPVDVWPDADNHRGSPNLTEGTRRSGLGPTASARRSSLRLADLAVDAGYYDQAHMDREFNALAGCPPVTWLAEEFRNIQSGAALGE